MDPQKTQLNVRIPKDLHREVKATAIRKGLVLDEYAERVFRAAVQAEAAAQAPGFLEALEKFLQKHLGKKT